MTTINAGVFAHLFDSLPDDWTVEPLADVVDFQEGPGILAVDFHDSGIPLLRLSSIAGAITTFTGCNYLDPNKVEKKWSHFKLKEGDILLSTSGSLGRVSVVAKEQEGSICYTGIIRFRPKIKGLRYSYIEYFLQSRLFEQQALASASGSVLSHFGPSHLKQMSFPVPPESYQVFIEQQIAPIDSKIELNRQTNQTLEQIAQAIFKSWFVDFEPVKAKIEAKQEWSKRMTAKDGGNDEITGENFVELAAMCAISGKTEEQLKDLIKEADAHGSANVAGGTTPRATLQQLLTTTALFPDALVESELGEIPEGWGFTLNGEVMDVRDGTHDSPKQSETGFPLVTSTHITTGELNIKNSYLISEEDYENINKRSNVEQGDILLTMIGTVGIPYLVIQSEINFAIKNIGLFRTSESVELRYYFYLLLKSKGMQQYLEARIAGTTQKYLSLKTLRTIEMILPTHEMLSVFNSVVEPLLNKIFDGLSENETLGDIRDALLPRLLAGDEQLNEVHEAI